MSFYEVGLNNVGSYQVSGRPWLKSVTLAPGEATSVLFPSVTSEIAAVVNSNTDVAKLGFLNPDNFDASRAIDMADDQNTYYSSNISPNLPGSTGISISFWFKPEAGPDERIVQVNSSNFRVQTRDPSKELRMVLGGSIIQDSGVTYTTGVWNHAVIIFANNASVIYTNGVKGTVQTTYSSYPNFSSIFFGSNAVSYQDLLDDAMLINRPLTDPEVTELYNGGSLINPSELSFSSDVISYWAFDDNLTPADSINTINDRISSNDLALTQGSTPAPSFIDARLEIPMTNLLSLKDSFTFMNCKTQRVYIKALPSNSGNITVSIFASLTNIPSSQMYELTGPGIDE